MASKRCPRCETEQPLSAFARRGEGHQPYCRACNRAYQRAHYRAHSAAYKRRARERADLHKRAVREWVWAYLESSGCTDCGLRDPRVLDLDHRDSAAKDFAVSQALNGSYTLARVKAQVAKCDVRCANCHRLRTAEQVGWYAWRDDDGAFI